MKERPEFSDEEWLEIAQVARQVADVGESCVNNLVLVKFELMKLQIKAVHSGVIIDDVHYTSGELRHEIDVVSEVVRQARTILQFEGRDSLSELDRHSIESGWGSIFDPESKMSKQLRESGVDLFRED